MARYSTREGRWIGNRGGNVTLPKAMPDNRCWHTELPSGLTRVEHGAPIPRLPCETQPVVLKVAPAEPMAPPAPAPQAPVASAPAPIRQHRAITREP